MQSNLNRFCRWEDWNDPSYRATMRRLMPDLAAADAAYPTGSEHRKVWEYAHVLNALDEMGVLHPEACVLSVGGGHEEPAYDLTNRVRWVFLTDIYGQGSFQELSALTSVLANPDQYARGPYNRRRLVVQHMNGLDLRFEDNTFDVVFSFSAIEHFGSVEAAKCSLREIHRVLKPNGVAAITTECIVNDAPQYESEGLILFRPEEIARLVVTPGLRLVEDIDFTMEETAKGMRRPLLETLELWKKGQDVFPQIVLDFEGRSCSSLAMFFRKSSDNASAA